MAIQFAKLTGAGVQLAAAEKANDAPVAPSPDTDALVAGIV